MTLLGGILERPHFTPAFVHRRTRAIIKSPGFHDYYVLPEASQGLYDDDDELLPWTRDYVDGFVDATGKFFTRKQAAAAVKDLLPGVKTLTTEDLRGLGRLTRTIPTSALDYAAKKLQRKMKTCGVSKAALRAGMKVELEHKDVTKGGIEKTARIALTHLCERKDYYQRLKKYVEEE